MSARRPHPRVLATTLFGVLVLECGLAAQSGFDLGASRPLGHTYFSDPSGIFTRTAALQMTGDLRPDALLLVDDELVLSISPGIYHALVTLPGPALDYCPVPGAGLLKRDAVLLSGTGPTLELWHLNAAGQQFVMQAVGNGVGAGAVQLQATNLDGDSQADVVGVSADRGSIVLLHGPLRSATAELVALWAMTPGETIHRLIPIEWDGTPGTEFALLTTWGLRVLEQNGQQHYMVQSDGDDSDRIAAIRRAGSSDRLAWLLQVPGGLYYLFVIDAQAEDQLLYFGIMDPVALSAGDFDGDGLDDLCLSQQTTGQLAYLHNQAGSAPASFSWSDAAVWDPTSDGTGIAPAPENQASALLADLDQDGDGDVVFPVQKESVAAMLRNDLEQHLDRAPSVQAASYEYDLETQDGLLRLTLAAPVLPPAESERLEIVVWRQATLQNDERTQSPAIHSDSVPVLEWPLHVTIPLNDEPLYASTLFHIELRLADYEGGRPVSAAATAVWSFTTSEASKDDMLAFHEELLPEDILETPIDTGEESALPPGGGWTAPLPCIPCFADDTVPDP